MNKNSKQFNYEEVHIKEQIDLTFYHGSLFEIQNPDLNHSNCRNDFGNGFYVTTDYEQALRFVRQKIRYSRGQYESGYINKYHFESFKGLTVRQFSRADTEWLKTVAKYREKWSKNTVLCEFDVMIGKIADDNTSYVIDMYNNGSLGKGVLECRR